MCHCVPPNDASNVLLSAATDKVLVRVDECLKMVFELTLHDQEGPHTHERVFLGILFVLQFLVTRVSVKNPITRSMHFKFNCLTVVSGRTCSI